MTRSRNPSPHRRRSKTRFMTGPGRPLAEAHSPGEILALADGMSVDTAARKAVQSAKIALFEQRLGRAQRWLSVAGRFISLAHGLDGLDRRREDAAFRDEMRALVDDYLAGAAGTPEP